MVSFLLLLVVIIAASQGPSARKTIKCQEPKVFGIYLFLCTRVYGYAGPVFFSTKHVDVRIFQLLWLFVSFSSTNARWIILEEDSVPVIFRKIWKMKISLILVTLPPTFLDLERARKVIRFIFNLLTFLSYIDLLWVFYPFDYCSAVKKGHWTTTPIFYKFIGEKYLENRITN